MVSYLKQYKESKSYFRYEGRPFVSTFEVVNNTQNWGYQGPIQPSVGPTLKTAQIRAERGSKNLQTALSTSSVLCAGELSLQ